MKPWLIVAAIILFIPVSQARGQDPGAASHGTINVVLGNANGLVVLTDSMATSGNQQSAEPAQKLFRLDDRTVCTIAGLLSAGIPFEAFYPSTGAIIDAYRQELTGKPTRSITGKLRDLEFRLNLILSGVAGARQSFDPSASAKTYALDVIIAGYDADDHPRIEKLELRSRLVGGRFESSTEQIVATDVSNKLVYVLGGMPDAAEALLTAAPSTSPASPALAAYASSIARDGGESFSIQQMRDLAIELAAETHKSHAEVGGPNQIAVLQNGRISGIVQPSLPKPKAPLAFGLMQKFGADGDGAIGNLAPMLCIECSFKNLHLELDRNYFVGTTFENAVLIYDGGQTVLDQGSNLVGCVLKLGPHADVTSPLAQLLIHGFKWLRIDYDRSTLFPLRVPS
jgi:20S proteasome alpha/beta subunit